ncbi:PREDICTED: nischarin [Nicrophorus vespilloides]|uniref:Nischarin n=1 Tax=Nicrophorus vespilloides TaxID=110193 RepID=A0ABM1MDG2_NICVS|nr:PREDICTED: nischarin [Nicrophorus vespilloides]
MASYWSNLASTNVQIPVSEEVSGITHYRINMSVGKVQWTVLHRYREFYALHQTLVSEHGLAQDQLPPKRLLRNKCPYFIEKRRHGLEQYLRYTLIYLRQAMPQHYYEFLEFQHYDTFYMLQAQASYFYNEADNILSTTNSFFFNTLQLHAIGECVRGPSPYVYNVDRSTDISHVLDFCSKLNKLTLRGDKSMHMNSNIIPNELPIEFSPFKVLRQLDVIGINMEMVTSADSLRASLVELRVLNNGLTSIMQVLQCDVLHKSTMDTKMIWTSLTLLDLSSNNLDRIDETIKLLPNLERLILNNNKIKQLDNLFMLSNLRHLHLSNNKLVKCDDMHTKLGNITTLDLSQNGLWRVDGLSKLYSLEHLDLSTNNIMKVENVACLGNLPCLENISLTGNPVSTTIDYRVKVLEYFKENYVEICLDNEKPTQQELDKVGVLRALRIVREGKRPSFNN